MNFTHPGNGRRRGRLRAGPRAAVVAAAAVILGIGVAMTPCVRGAAAFPLSGEGTVLPAGTDLNEEQLYKPLEVFRSQAAGGAKSYLINLGDLAFNSSLILGGAARRAGISCGTCHVNGAGNGRLYVPGLSTRPGTFDTTGALFNPRTHNRVLDAVRIPSLRGARDLAPYGNDGRTASLRDFVRNVIVNEFAGPEPAPQLLDAMIAYIEDIDFVPNLNLDAGGRLSVRASEQAHRGEVLFLRPFPHNPELSCAGCHLPSGGFVDHRAHDVGSGGLFKTPTLMNANFNAPYFHDGRFDTYEQVVDHFERIFALGYSAQERADLVAYLQAAGAALMPFERDGITSQLKEINDFASVLATAIPAHDADVVALTVTTVGSELRDLVEQFPSNKDTTVSDGIEQRLQARGTLKNLVLMIREIGVDAAAGRFEDAAVAYDNYSKLTFAAVPIMLKRAEPWSLYNPAVHAAHYAEMRRLLKLAPQRSR